MGLKIFTSKIWKKYSPKISPLFSDAAGAHISDLWPYFHFLILLHLLYAQMGPFSFVEKNYVQGWNFHLKKLDVVQVMQVIQVMRVIQLIQVMQVRLAHKWPNFRVISIFPKAYSVSNFNPFKHYEISEICKILIASCLVRVVKHWKQWN